MEKPKHTRTCYNILVDYPSPSVCFGEFSQVVDGISLEIILDMTKTLERAD